MRAASSALPASATPASAESLIAANARLHAELERLTARQTMLQHIGHHLQQTLDLDVLIGRIFFEVNQALQAEAQSIWLADGASGTISCPFATGPGAAQVKAVRVALGEGIVGATVQHRRPFLVADAQQDPRHSRRADTTTGRITRSLLSVPLVRNGVAIGAMQAINKRGGIFTDDDLEIFGGIAEIAALAIENARLYAALEASYDATLDALAAALDLRDEETEGHSRRVVAYTGRLAEQVGMNADAIRRLRRGALIHDIGKIGVPDAILRKRGPLTSEEWAVMQQHPIFGYEMLRGIPHLRDNLEIVLAHQERWDGQGYPYGLRGDAIPLAARLFAVADTLDALLSDRPYRKGCGYARARHVIAAEAGRQFDPAVVAAFLAVPERDWKRLRQKVARDAVERAQAYRVSGAAGDQTGEAFLPLPLVRLTGGVVPSADAA